jgi:sterol desaturase/sphingolipid hydroxylase (fatty acid hydroxylase superfamily)
MDALPRSPWILALVFVLVGVEAAWRLRSGRAYDFGAAAPSFGVAAVNMVIKPASGLLMGAVLLTVREFTPLHLPLGDWRVWAAGFVLVEFVYYWFHRWSHTVRWLWASHAVHHTAAELTLPAAIRLGWTGLISGGWLLFAPLIALGFHPAMVTVLLSANLAYQLLLHTEAVGRLGPLEYVLNTPAHHRVHHASNEGCLDRNFGGVVIIWDRLFGTFAEAPAHEPLRYGLVHPVRSKNPVSIALHEWARLARDLRHARGPGDAWAAAFGRPH